MSRSILSILFLVIGLLVFVLLVLPQYKILRVSQEELSDISGITSELETIAGARDKLIDTYNSIPQTNLNRIEKMLPTGPDASYFLTKLEALAVKNGLALKRLDLLGDLGASMAGGGRGQPTPGGSLPAVSSPGQNFVEFPLSLGLEGSYDSFRGFLKSLEKNIRLVDVNEISFGSVRPGVFDFSLKLKAYYQ